jgi:hypothetical protein
VSTISSTKIFQYIPALKTSINIKKKTSYWLDRIHKNEEQKTHNSKDLLARIKILEQNADSDSYDNSVKNNTDSVGKTPETRGLEQLTKDKTIKIESDKNKLDELIRKSNRSIVSISSVFPWSFFPNTIDVEESRVTFIFRQLFASQSHSVDIKDISNVFIESGFFFATLQIVSKTFVQNDIKIEYLKKKDAYRTRDIIEGLRTFIQNDINSSNYEIGDLVDKLNELNIPKTVN